MAVLVSYYLLYFLTLEKSWFSCRSFLGYPLLKGAKDEKIERIFNFKYPYEYINGFDELISRKTEIGEFYDKYFK